MATELSISAAAEALVQFMVFSSGVIVRDFSRIPPTSRMNLPNNNVRDRETSNCGS